MTETAVNVVFDPFSELLVLAELRSLWDALSRNYIYQEKRRLLIDFLKRFLETFANLDSDLMRLRFGDTFEISQGLSFYLVEEIACLLKSTSLQLTSAPPSVGIYEYFAGLSAGNEGLYLLRVLEVLTRKDGRGIPSCLGRLLVTVLVKILSLPPNYLTLSMPSVHRSTSHRLFPAVQVPTFNFPPICSFFNYSAVHPLFSSLFPTLLNPPSSTSQNSPRPSSPLHSNIDVSMNSTCGTVCYHILSILGNLFCDEQILDELLMKQNCVNQLLEILSLNSQTMDCGLFIVHRQLVRSLSKLICTACESVITIGNLQHRQVIPYLISVLKQAPVQSISPVICLEISQLVVFTLKKSAKVWHGLFDDFGSHDGYSVLADNLIYVSKFGSLNQKLEFISSLCHLLFIGNKDDPVVKPAYQLSVSYEEDNAPKGNTPNRSVLNVEVFKIFLRVFAGTTDDTKAELLKTMRTVFSLGANKELGPECTEDGFSLLKHLDPFSTLFQQFDSLSISSRRTVLAMMDEVLSLHGSLGQEEMRSYCFLLQGKRPSTLLLVTQHMTALLAEGRLSGDKMRTVGLAPILVEYLIPPRDLPCSVMLVDQDELALAVSLLPHTYPSLHFFGFLKTQE